MSKFFHNNATGVKADIARHREQEKALEEKIAKLEAIPEAEHNQFHDRYLQTYRQFLYQLHLSKAEVVAKIGKTK